MVPFNALWGLCWYNFCIVIIVYDWWLGATACEFVAGWMGVFLKVLEGVASLNS